MNTPRLSADARREQILDVAIDVFGRSGYYGASMNDIAEAAGVTKPVLYQHFDSKHELFLELLRQVSGDVERVIGEEYRAVVAPSVADDFGEAFACYADQMCGAVGWVVHGGVAVAQGQVAGYAGPGGPPPMTSTWVCIRLILAVIENLTFSLHAIL